MVSILVYCKHLLCEQHRAFKWLGSRHKGLNQEEKRRRNDTTLTDEVKAEALTSKIHRS